MYVKGGFVMNTIIVRACIILAIFCLGIVVGSYYSQQNIKTSPDLFVSNVQTTTKTIDYIQYEETEEVNTLTEIGKKLAEITSVIMRTFVQWIISFIP